MFFQFVVGMILGTVRLSESNHPPQLRQTQYKTTTHCVLIYIIIRLSSGYLNWFDFY